MGNGAGIAARIIIFLGNFLKTRGSGSLRESSKLNTNIARVVRFTPIIPPINRQCRRASWATDCWRYESEKCPIIVKELFYAHQRRVEAGRCDVRNVPSRLVC